MVLVGVMLFVASAQDGLDSASTKSQALLGDVVVKEDNDAEQEKEEEEEEEEEAEEEKFAAVTEKLEYNVTTEIVEQYDADEITLPPVKVVTTSKVVPTEPTTASGVTTTTYKVEVSVPIEIESKGVTIATDKVQVSTGMIESATDRVESTAVSSRSSAIYTCYILPLIFGCTFFIL